MKTVKLLEKDIKEKNFKNVYLLYGEENYLKRSYKNRLKKAILNDENDTMTIPCSNVLLSVGQGTVWGDLLKDEAVEFRGPAPVADPVTYQTTVDDIFVGGDMFTGPRFAIDAIAAGKEAAISIHRFVQPGS